VLDAWLTVPVFPTSVQTNRSALVCYKILSFLRTFKEAADHNDVGEGAAARLIPFFLKDAATEGYRAHMDETTSRMLQYPYMVQYLLDTYALDDELAKVYVTVSTAKQLEGEDERAF
jgi:hypothetical protein